ncbi:MAG TPA: hypothetical protein VME67_16570 [Mycobacterium sp.]|nr:hypothetical protein [Mycobacterium sp.]HTX96327.1 hypothetical protein [Mycobacterium sp.]
MSVPGVEPKTIGCQDFTFAALALIPRFAWRGEVPERLNQPADYSVAAGDWLLLVKKFGLTPPLVDRTDKA